ncbi:DUF4167 domain-containing protein [Candidatus Pelagibacter sp.]|nr:DUF4167 domain-containing protein [Candidatus Pelagibacter sp.]
MRTFRNNNNKRGRFRSGDRGYKRNGESPKFNSDFSSNANFKRKVPGRNNHNASKLIEKYNDLAREALSNGDKILSENYFQHADHFMRILAEQEKSKVIKSNNDQNQKKIEVVTDNTKQQDLEDVNQDDPNINTIIKT